MYKYLICIILGIFLFLLYNNYDSFSVGVPNFLYLKNDRGEWEVKNTLDPLLTDLSGYTERLKDIFVFPHIVEAREYKDGIVTNPRNIHFFLEEDDIYCNKYPIIIDVQDKLVELNTRLQTKCPSLRLDTIDITDTSELTEDINDILKSLSTPSFSILFLYYNDEIISSVSYIYNSIVSVDILEIHIITEDKYKKRKYMSLLSSVMFITASMIICNYRIKSLHFSCTNPITAYYLLNKFNFSIDYIDYSDNFRTDFLTITEYTFENLKTFMDNWTSIMIIIELTPENIRRAQVMFDELVGDGDKSIICPEVVIQDTTCGAQSK